MIEMEETLEENACSGRVSTVVDIASCVTLFVSFSVNIFVCLIITFMNIVTTIFFKTFHHIFPLQKFKQLPSPPLKTSTTLDSFWRRPSLYLVFQIFRQECFSEQKTPTSKYYSAWLVFVDINDFFSIAGFIDLYFMCLPWASNIRRIHFLVVFTSFYSNGLTRNSTKKYEQTHF